MKRSTNIWPKGALAGCLIAISVTCFYFAAAPYLGPQIRYFRQAVPGGRDGRAKTNNSGRLDESVGHLLPERWQAEWISGTLCVTHSNSNGTLADSLLFDSIQSFYDWAEAHPDFCDLDVEKVAFGAQ